MLPRIVRLAGLSFICALSLAAAAQSLPPQTASAQNFFAALQWRLIGPHRGGRTLAVSGVRGQPETFYSGAVGGGVWQTTDGGHVWTPIFDAQPIASIGALVVAPSDPNIIYVGTGEADMRSDITFGDGMYKSTDAGKTWTHLGLRDTQQIGQVLVDPRDPNIVLVAALGHGFGPNVERGVFRSTDGGQSWRKTLYKDEHTGAIDLAYDSANAQTVYAALWNVRRVAWSAYAPLTGPGGGLYKSTDGGQTWQELRGHGLPAGQTGRIGLAVARGGQRVYALIEAEQRGLYRSDDAGANWQLVSADPRINNGRSWYFSSLTLDPRNPDVVYAPNVSLYRSLDGGRTFQTIKGAPGGDDYHTLWIDPDNSQRMILASDQGTVISVDGARTWSSWYNQPTAQFYHVAVDNQFPYWVYGAQQDSGTAAVISRSNYGQISFRDWHPIGAGESGYILPDPLNPDIVYGGSTGGELYRWTQRTGQVQDISPTLSSPVAKVKHRYPWTTPIVFAPHAPNVLYQASQFLMKTTDNGMSWTLISPDLTQRANAQGVPEDNGKAVIYTVAPSPLKAGQIWIGTDNGLVQLTRDEGKTWATVAPPGLPDWSIVSNIDASPFAAATAYAAVDRHQVDDLQPYIYRTHDYGKTWDKITDGIPAPAYVRVVRADPVRPGLLFAGTELGVYVSFDDGGHWQSLQLNLPVASVRDLLVKDNDLVVATHGRSFWILDDISPLRQFDATTATAAHLFQPAPAFRLRQNENRDTPLPPETPAGMNPPTGALIDYTLPAATGEVTLEIFDAPGQLVRRFSSNDEPHQVADVQTFPTYWLRPPAPLSAQAGPHRFVWDLRYPRPLALRYDYSIAAAYGADTPTDPQGPLVLPGMYQLKLTVAGRTLTAPLEVKLDPRVSVRPGALKQQFDLAMSIGQSLADSSAAVQQVRELRRQLTEVQERSANDPANKDIAAAAHALDAKLAVLLEAGAATQTANMVALNGDLAGLMTTVTAADAAPTAQAITTFAELRPALDAQLASWAAIKRTNFAALNTMLQGRGRAPLKLPE